MVDCVDRLCLVVLWIVVFDGWDYFLSWFILMYFSFVILEIVFILNL